MLAAAVCHDNRVADEFYDGILWANFGQRPDVLSLASALYIALTSERPSFLGIEDAAASLQQALGFRRCLIVLDDVWQERDIQPFLRGGSRCATLITTRNRAVGRATRSLVEIGELTRAESVRILAADLNEPATDYAPLIALAERLGRFPLALRLAGSMLAARVHSGDSVERALDYVVRSLDRRGITAFDRSEAAESNVALSQAFELSLEQLTPEERDECASLAAFPENARVSLRLAQMLWEMDDLDAEDFAHKLDTLSLAQLDLRDRTISLHPLLREYLRTSLQNRGELQKRESQLMNQLMVRGLRSRNAGDREEALRDFPILFVSTPAMSQHSSIEDLSGTRQGILMEPLRISPMLFVSTPAMPQHSSIEDLSTARRGFS